MVDFDIVHYLYLVETDRERRKGKHLLALQDRKFHRTIIKIIFQISIILCGEVLTIVWRKMSTLPGEVTEVDEIHDGNNQSTGS